MSIHADITSDAADVFAPRYAVHERSLARPTGACARNRHQTFPGEGCDFMYTHHSWRTLGHLYNSKPSRKRRSHEGSSSLCCSQLQYPARRVCQGFGRTHERSEDAGAEGASDALQQLELPAATAASCLRRCHALYPLQS